MFNLQSFSAQKSLISDGAVSISLARIRGLLTKLLHSPETGVVYLQNDDTVPIVRGMISAFTDNNAVQPCIDNDPTLYKAVCVSLNDSILDGEWGFFRFAGEVEVRIIDGINPDPSEVIYVSAIEGPGTNVRPVAAGTWAKPVGIVLDDSMYISGDNPFVRIVLEPCCGEFNPIL